MAWQRAGECCRCGQCCTGLPPDEMRVTPLMARVPPVAGYCPLFEWAQPAPPLAAPGTRIGHCAGHVGVVPEGQEDPYYMSGCNVWPTDPAQIANYPGCSYTFTWVDD